MNRSSKPWATAKRNRSTASSSFTPRSRTVLILTGDRPASRAAVMPSRTSPSRSRRVISVKRSGRRVSRETLSRLTPAAARRGGAAGEADAVGRQGDVRARGECGRRGDHVFEPAAEQGLAAGEPQLAHAQVADGDGDQPDELGVGELLGPRHPGQALGGHAVGAAQVAAVGQRDPQVRGDPAEAVDQPRIGGSGRVAGRSGARTQRRETELGGRHLTSVTASQRS